MSEYIECELHSKSDWIEVFPYGLTVWAESDRPVMIFKDEKGQRVLPVWMSAVDAGMAISDSRAEIDGNSPHFMTSKILGELKVKAAKCYFTEVKGQSQLVEIEFEGNDQLKKLEAKAHEAMSFCLSQKMRFFATSDVIESCRQMDIEAGKHPQRTALQRQRDRYLN